MKRESTELYPMLDLEEAVARVLAAFEPLGPEEVPIIEALGQVLAGDVVADRMETSGKRQIVRSRNNEEVDK